MSSNLQNSIWPNTDGNLGNIKVQIPDGVTSPWPTGDALVGNFVYHKGKLVGLVDTKALIANSSKTTTFPYEYVNVSLPSIAEGEMTYNYDQCTYVVLDGKVIKGDVSSDEELEIITKKYTGCKTVDDIKAVDPNYKTNDIINGVWKEGLADLENGYRMFYNCSNLISFSSDLSSLTNGYRMFQNCPNLTSFSSELPSLTNGNDMFNGCKLDTDSVQRIADTINTASNIKLDIGIGNSSPNTEEEAAFNKMVSKGWIVFVNSNYYGGDESGYYGYTASASLAASVMTLDEIGESEMFNPKPYWAKPVQTDEEHARYVDSEGNFFNILGAQFIYGDDLSTYGMFTSLEDAAAQMRLKKIGEEEMEIETA